MQDPTKKKLSSAELAANPVLAAAIEAMKSQLLIVLVGRLGGRVDIPAIEIDGTGGTVMTMDLDPLTKVFTFELRSKDGT